MKATGIVRRIDDLGRVVIPKEIRRTMRIREGDPLEIFTNSDGCLSVAGGGKRELADKNISPALAQIMEGRQIYQYEEGETQLPVSDYSDHYIITTAAPILAEGDV